MTLEDFFHTHTKAALALSGGTDSVYLLYAAKKCGADIKAFFVKTAFQPQFELNDALKAAKAAGIKLNVIEADILAVPNVAQNTPERCYYCKKAIFSAIAEHAAAQGCDTVIDGTNFSDDVAERAGMRALKELGVLSPLRMCQITKTEVRLRSEKAGLFTWDKPSYACLATRILTGEKINPDALKKVEKSENELFKMGYRDFRVRVFHSAARLQFKDSDMPRAAAEAQKIRGALKEYFDVVMLDLDGRK